jgi:tetratricopeptide (TPR) repeat protein
MQPQKSLKIESPKAKLTLPVEIQKDLDDLFVGVVELEKKEYHNDLVPFSQHEQFIRAQGQEAVGQIYDQLNRGKKVLKELFEFEERQNPQLPDEVRHARWEEGSQALKEKMLQIAVVSEEESNKSAQELCGISWAFMNRAYLKAKYLLDEKRYEDASCLFMFLRYLNSEVFEFWLGEAIALQELAKFEEALESYTMTLLLQPDNPYCFFEMADCLYQLKEMPACVEALNLCIEYAATDPQYAELLKMAEDSKRQLEVQKVI